MKQVFPDTDIKAEPHISSKIKVWKKYHLSLSMMMEKSGFSLTQSGYLDVRDDQVWTEYLKIDPNAKTMRYKSWPFYAQWCDIFGKDRATGENATGFVDAVNGVFNMPSSPTTPNAPRRSETNNNTCPAEEHMHEEANVHDGECSVSAREKRSRKRKKIVEEDNQFVGMLSSFCKEIAKNISDMVVRVGHAHDATKRRGKVYEVLKGMPNLTMEEKLLTTKYLCNKTKELDMFFSLDDDARVKMVQMIVENRF
ncbi:RNase H family protein [Striga asiatica]|uniref:RNase H family protein n=1 Tax=Striga asiatica TaxID=4170 RepID=A0A5A7QC84_STRAF|nr:RNase H family protein [Striga asiatica]